MLRSHAQLISLLFAAFAARVPSLDVISLHAWQMLVHDVGLVQPVRGARTACTWQHLQTVFMEADGMRKKAERAEEELRQQLKSEGKAIPVPNPPRAKLPRAVNEGSVTTEKAAGGHLKHYLSRVEFLPALVKAAVNMYILPQETADVSDALDRLLTQVIAPRMDVARLASAPDAYRRRLWYSQPVCDVLKRNEPALRRCFAAIAQLDAATPPSPTSPTKSSPNKRPSASGAAGGGGGGSGRGSGGGGGGGGSSASAMGSPTRKPAGGTAALSISAEEWMYAVECFRIGGADLSDRDALRIFGWSRTGLVTSPALYAKAQLRDSRFAFEGFCEAVCHLALIKALPTDRELRLAAAEGSAAGGLATALRGTPPSGDHASGQSNDDQDQAHGQADGGGGVDPCSSWDAGRFMLDLWQSDGAAYERMLLERRREWPPPIPPALADGTDEDEAAVAAAHRIDLLIPLLDALIMRCTGHDR